MQRKLSRFWAYALLLGALLLSFCVKVWLINSRDLWLDETYSAFVAKLPFFELLRFVAGDVHPPLFYLLLSGWVRLFGDAQVQLRLFSVALSVAGTIPMFFLARRALGPRFGAYATALFAFSPMLLVYSSEVRSYMLFLLTLLCLLLVHWMIAVEQKDGRWMILLYGALSAMLFYVHYLSVFILVGLFSHWVFHPGRDNRRILRICAAALLTLVLASPGIPILLSQRTQKAALDHSLYLSRSNPTDISFKAELPKTNDSILAIAKGATVLSGFYPATSPILRLLFAIPLALAISGIGYLWFAKGDQICRLFGFMLLASLAGVLAAHLGAARYLLPMVPLLILALARVVQYWTRSATTHNAGLAIGATLLCLYFAGFYQKAVRPHQHSWRDLIAVLQQDYRPGDKVVFDALYSQVPFDYTARHQHFEPEETGFPVSIYEWWGRQPFKAWGGPVISQSDLDNFVSRQTAEGTKTLWVVSYEAMYYDPRYALLDRLQRMGQISEIPLPPDAPGSRSDDSPLRLTRITLK